MKTLTLTDAQLVLLQDMIVTIQATPEFKEALTTDNDRKELEMLEDQILNLS